MTRAWEVGRREKLRVLESRGTHSRFLEFAQLNPVGPSSLLLSPHSSPSLHPDAGASEAVMGHRQGAEKEEGDSGEKLNSGVRGCDRTSGRFGKQRRGQLICGVA